jgi:hypothetical protein
LSLGPGGESNELFRLSLLLTDTKA